MPDAPEVNAAIVGAVKGWYAEHPFADPSDILKFSRGKNLALK